MNGIRWSECRSCKARIFWASTKIGKNMPIDAEQVAGGNVELVQGVAVVVRPDGGTRYQAHFVSCPNADTHRKRAS